MEISPAPEQHLSPHARTADSKMEKAVQVKQLFTHALRTQRTTRVPCEDFCARRQMYTSAEAHDTGRGQLCKQAFPKTGLRSFWKPLIGLTG